MAAKLFVPLYSLKICDAGNSDTSYFSGRCGLPRAHVLAAG